MNFNIYNINGRNWLEKLYIYFIDGVVIFFESAIPYIRQMIRFISIPYVFLFLIDWSVCKKNKFEVFFDLFYIFFKLKTFPDHYLQCKLWEKPRNEWSLYWGSNYNPFQRRSLRRVIQPAQYTVLYEDKLLCQYICELNGLNVPNFYGIIEPGQNLTERLDEIRIYNDLRNVNLVIKPLDGKGGHDIMFYGILANGDIVLRYPENFKLSVAGTRFIVQEAVIQNSELNGLAKSINTIRFVTALDKDHDVINVGAYLRVGLGDAYVDNLSKGGGAIRIDIETGELIGDLFDRNGNRILHEGVPDKLISGFSIPLWDDVVSLARETQINIPYHRLIGMDIAVADNGPKIIEINSIYDNIDLESICGPLFRSERLVKFFQDYSLFFCEKQVLDIKKFHAG